MHNSGTTPHHFVAGKCRFGLRPRDGAASVPEDAVVLSADDAADLSDRVYQVRCAAEDVATAIDEGAAATELRQLCEALIHAARAADGWRRAGV